MKYFSTSLSTILLQSFIDRPVFADDDSMMMAIQRDLDRIQITDGSSYSSSLMDTELEFPIVAKKTEQRNQFDSFFLDYFQKNKENLPYNQGMITGHVVDATLLKNFGEDQEKVLSFLDNNKGIEFCYQTKEGDWKGVFVKVNLESKEWFAVVTDFSCHAEQSPHVAIVGIGECFDILERSLHLQQGEIDDSQEPMSDLIDNYKLQLYLKYLDTHLMRLKNLEQQKSGEKFPSSEVYRQCFHPLVTMGLSKEIMENQESYLRKKELVNIEDNKKEEKSSWNPFRIRR